MMVFLVISEYTITSEDYLGHFTLNRSGYGISAS